MSAFVVDAAHINAIVNVATSGPKDGHIVLPLYWNSSVDGRTNWKQIADLTSDDQASPQDVLGQLLWDENVKSVNYRYNEHDEPETFSWKPFTRRLTAVQAIKAIHCYQYQSCEHPEWETSEAKAITDALEDALVRALPGYDDAEWSISA